MTWVVCPTYILHTSQLQRKKTKRNLKRPGCIRSLGQSPVLRLWRCLTIPLWEISKPYGSWERTRSSLDPNQHHVISALKSLQFFVVQDIFLTEIGRISRCGPASCAFLEKQGTVANTERRVQLMNKVVSPGKAKDDWWIITEVAKRMGADWNYKKPGYLVEIRKVTPSYAGMTYERIKRVAPVAVSHRDHPEPSSSIRIGSPEVLAF